MNYVAQINSHSKLCHGPEDGAGDQSLVGDAIEQNSPNLKGALHKKSSMSF